jgi:hypothetical protein
MNQKVVDHPIYTEQFFCLEQGDKRILVEKAVSSLGNPDYVERCTSNKQCVIQMDTFFASENLIDHNFPIMCNIPSSDNAYWSINGTIHSNNKGVASLPVYLSSHQPANKRVHVLNAGDGVKRLFTDRREQGQCVKKIGSAFLSDPQVRLDVSQIGGHMVTPTSVETHEQENQHDGTCDASNSEEETTFVNE